MQMFDSRNSLNSNFTPPDLALHGKGGSKLIPLISKLKNRP